MSDAEHSEGGLVASLKRAWQTLNGLAASRVELFLLELKEERLRLFDALLLVGVCLICALMALAVVTFAVVVLFWDDHRMLVLAFVAVAYAAGAVAAFCTLRRRLQQWQAYAATLDQIKKDRSCLENAN